MNKAPCHRCRCMALPSLRGLCITCQSYFEENTAKRVWELKQHWWAFMFIGMVGRLILPAGKGGVSWQS